MVNLTGEEVTGMSKKAIGIIGGMGPEATLDLFGKVIRHTDASCDAEHIRVYIDCHTGIPDRTRAILEGGESPVPYIAESAEKLAAMGADFLLLPCNTSHYYYDDIAARSPVPVVNMIRTAAEELRRCGVRRVGVLATDGTLRSGVYQKELNACGIEAICPEGAEQAAVMSLIYDGIKANAPTFDIAPVERVLAHLRDAGAERLVLGCTELPVAVARYGIHAPDALDATDVLARAAVAMAGYPVKNF